MGLFYRLTRIHSSTVFTKVSTHSSQSFARITSREVKGKNLWVVTFSIVSSLLRQSSEKYIWFKEQINESISDNVVLLTTCCNLITLFV